MRGGKKAAGRLLDGRAHGGMPEVVDARCLLLQPAQLSVESPQGLVFGCLGSVLRRLED